MKFTVPRVQSQSNNHIVISLPIPNKVLSPNYRTATPQGRMMVATSIKKHRWLSRDAILRQSMGGRRWGYCIVEVTFYHRTERRRDEDNLIGSLKAYYDGIVDSGLAVDDDSKHMRRCIPYSFIDKESPRVEFLITEGIPGENCDINRA